MGVHHRFEHVDDFAHMLMDITATEANGKRYYETPTGKKYPSVTTVLGANPAKKQSLMEWRRRVGHAEANRVTNEATSQGTAMHLMCERFLKNQSNYLETDNPYAPAMFEQLRPKLIKNVNKIIALEAPLWSDLLQLAGRTDCIGEWEGKRSIIDFKTSMKPKKKAWIEDYFKQACAYACMFRERTGVPIPQIVIIIAVRESEPQIFVQNCKDWIDPLIQATDYYYAMEKA